LFIGKQFWEEFWIRYDCKKQQHTIKL